MRTNTQSVEKHVVWVNACPDVLVFVYLVILQVSYSTASNKTFNTSKHEEFLTNNSKPIYFKIRFY